MTKPLKSSKQTVELEPPARPSRIRREPVRIEIPADLANSAWWRSEEWEVPLAIAGILLFAIALNALWFGVNQFLIK